MVFAIGDAGDAFYDSGLFLEAGGCLALNSSEDSNLPNVNLFVIDLLFLHILCLFVAKFEIFH